MKFRSLFTVPVLTTYQSVAMLLLRLICGLGFMFHGWGKIQAPFGWMGPEAGTPAVFQFLAALSEFGGGLAWILGLLTPLASFGILCTMSVATWMHAIVMGDPFVGQGSSYELAAVYWSVALVLIFVGPGRFSLDWKLFTKE